MATITVPHSITTITFFEDRAQVERSCQQRLPAGVSVLRFEGISPAAYERSLLVRCQTARVVDARFDRQWRLGKEEATPDVAALIAEAELLRDQSEANAAEGELLALKQQRHAQLLDATLQSLRRETSWGAAMPTAALAAAQRLLDEQRALGRERRVIEHRHHELLGKWQVVERRAAALRAPDAVLKNVLVVTLECSAEAQAQLDVAYMVPCALWRPTYRATLTGDTLRMELAAAVWQATGEEWRGVRTRFSTARSTARAEPPVLADDWLQSRVRAEKTIQARVTEQAINTTGQGMDEDEVPGVDDGGESRLLEAAGPVDIAADGRLCRVPIAANTSPALRERLCRPEKSPYVFLRVEATNTGAHPYLAGPVELIREHGNAGVTQLGFIAPGEKFHLSFGGDPSLRVVRNNWESRDVAKLTGKLTIKRDVSLLISNLGVTSSSFVVEERVPVSELAQVEVELDDKRTAPKASADKDGIVRWTVDVQALGHLQMTLGYQLTASSEIKGL